MKKFKYILSTLILATILSFSGKASHISGGDISFTCLGNNQYLITLNVFRACAGISQGTTEFVTIQCPGQTTQNVTMNIVPGYPIEVSQLCNSLLPSSNCNGGSLTGMQQYTYQAVVTMPPCSTWTIANSSCCRSAAINNLTSPSSQSWYFFAQMNNIADTCNSSPAFTAQPIPYVCVNQPVSYNFGAIEPDGDSLVFTLTNPLGTGLGNNLAYSGGASVNQPILGATVSLNSQTGQLSFTPTTIGIYVVAVRVDEYDPATGVLISSTMRDIQIVVQACTNSVPLLSGGSSVGGNIDTLVNYGSSGAQIASPNNIEVCYGDTFTFNIVFEDSDTINGCTLPTPANNYCLKDTITITSNIASALPGASMVVTGVNPATATIGWTAVPGANPYSIVNLVATDSQCPVPGNVSASVGITIVQSTYAGPDKYICYSTQSAQLSATGGSVFYWFDANQDTIPVDSHFSCNPCSNPIASPDTTTMYIVSSNLSTNNCNSIDTVIVTVAPNFEITMPNDTFICYGDSILFAATVDTTFSSTYTWTNASTLSSGSILQPMGAPGINTQYVLTITSDSGCTKVDTFNVAVSPLPLPTASNDTSLCAGTTQQAQLSVQGAGVLWHWSVLSGSPMTPSNFTCNPCQYPMARPAITTTYIVEADSFGYCGNVDTVTVFIASDFNINMHNDTAICYGDTINLLTSLQGYSGGPATYSWQGTQISSTNTLSPNVWPPITQPYTLTVTSDSNCIKTETVTVTVSPPFPQTITATSDLPVVCVGELVNLGVDFGSTIPANCQTVPATCPGTSQVTLGNGTQQNATTGYPNVYGNWYWGARHQILIRATELNAMGVYGGILSSLALNVASISGTTNYQNFSIKLGCTSQNALNGVWLTGLQTVYTAGTYVVQTGWNTHTFGTQYAWDGVSNLIVEICFNNTSFTLNCPTFNNVTTFNSVQWYRADANGVCNSGTPTVSTQRPNIRFNYCAAADPNAFNYQWSTVSGNGIISNPTNIINPVAAVPNLSTFQVLVTDTFGACSGTSTVTVDVVTSYAGSIDQSGPYCITDNTIYNLTGSWSQGIPATWVGPGVVSPGVAPNYIGTFQPTLAGPGAHTISLIVGPGSNCQTTILDTIYVLPLPDVTIQDPGLICVSGGTVQMTNADLNPTGTAVWSGTGINPQGVFNPAVTGVGQFNIYYTQTLPCLAKDTFVVTVVPTFNSNFTMPVAMCEYDNPINLIPDSVGGVFSGPGVVGSTFNPGLAGPGTHYIQYSDANTLCPSQTSKPIVVNPLPALNMAILNPYLGPWCEGQDTSSFLTLPAPYTGTAGVNSQWGHGPNSNLTDTSTFGNVFVNFNIGDLAPGSHTLIYYVTVTSAGVGCSNSDSVDIVIVARPLAPTATSGSPYCSGELMDDILATGIAANTEVRWYNGFDSDGPNSFNNSGEYRDSQVASVPAGEAQANFSFWVTQSIPVSNGLCESEATEVPIVVYESPVASITASTESGREPLEVSFTNLSTPVDLQEWQWTFGNGESSTEFEPTVTYSHGSYVAQLVVSNPIGCTDTARVAIIVDALFQITFPEVFSPNGDQINDLFDIEILGAENFEGIIRDRWGKVVHKWTSNDEVWNGKRQNNGADCDEGVYFWTVSGTKVDGVSNFDQSGTITLLRGK